MSFLDILKKENIYNSKELKSFFISLEEKYDIVNNFEHYNNLVNFSQNKNVVVHDWFKYREGFAGALVDEIIDSANINKDFMVVDPFVGSGTTLVSSVLKGFDCIGVDVNPMSALISKIKSTKYTDKDLEDAKKKLQNLQSSFDGIKVDTSDNIAKYFNEDNFVSLLKIFEFLKSIKNDRVFEILFCAYLCIVEPSSNRKRDGNGLKTVQTKVSNVLEYYAKKVESMLKDIKSAGARYEGVSYTFTGTAKNLYDFYKSIGTKKKIGLIVFSPPYANSFDYFESYKLELSLGGFLTKEYPIQYFRETAVRSFIGGKEERKPDKYVALLAQEIKDAIPLKEKKTGKKDARTRRVPSMIMGYFKDMGDIIEQCYLCLESGCECHIVIDQSSYLGKIVPSDLLFAYLAEQIGFKVKRIIECRNAKTSGQQVNEFPYLKNGLRESIVVLTK